MDWVRNEMITGIQRLLCLGLEGQPAAEVIPGTVAAWCEAFDRGRLAEVDRDIPRMREAFSALLARSRRWPAPVEFIEALPRLVDRAQPALPITAEEQERRAAAAREAIAKLGELLRMDR